MEPNPSERSELKALLFASTFCLILGSCASSGEVIVVERLPESINAGQAESDSAGIVGSQTTIPATSVSSLGKVLTIGALEPIQSFDPLLATRVAELQAVHLLYERLFELNTAGQPIPSLVESYSISGDGLTYTFELKDDRFYSDSRIFSNGLGRRVSSKDVQFMIERMAGAGVPHHISSLFSSIAGFDLFSAEQRTLYDPELRGLGSIPGIRIKDDLTLSVTLTRPDPRFLHRLASPYASVYPHEAFRTGNTLLRSPVGSSDYILEDHVKEPYLTHIALRPGEAVLQDQTQNTSWTNILWKLAVDSASTVDRLRTGDVDWVPELGPNLMSFLDEMESDSVNDLRVVNSGTPLYFIIDGLSKDTEASKKVISDSLGSFTNVLAFCSEMELDGLLALNSTFGGNAGESGKTFDTDSARFTFTTHPVETAMATWWAQTHQQELLITPIHTLSASTPFTFRRMDGFHFQLGVFPVLNHPRMALRCSRTGLATQEFSNNVNNGAQWLEPWNSFDLRMDD